MLFHQNRLYFRIALLLVIWLPPCSTLFPYTTLFRSFWRPQFPYPDNGPGNPELRQTVYYVDYQGVRFIGLDSNQDRKSTRLNSSHVKISYAVFCLIKKKHI